MLSNTKEYIYEPVVKLVKSIGYKQRVGNYYVISEVDGYINVSYDFYGYIQFHKNFYHNYGNTSKKEIHKDFDNYLDFEKFMSSYHKKEMRKIKVEKLNNL